MTTRVFRTKQGHYEAARWVGENRSGIEPMCDRVLVLADKHADKSGHVLIPDSVAESASISGTTGVLVAVGPAAFMYDSTGFNRWPDDVPKPQPGARVCFQRFAGEEYMGTDGVTYRVMDYRSIGATMGMAQVDTDDELICGASNITFSSAAA